MTLETEWVKEIIDSRKDNCCLVYDRLPVGYTKIFVSVCKHW